MGRNAWRSSHVLNERPPVGNVPLNILPVTSQRHGAPVSSASLPAAHLVPASQAGHHQSGSLDASARPTGSKFGLQLGKAGHTAEGPAQCQVVRWQKETIAAFFPPLLARPVPDLFCRMVFSIVQHVRRPSSVCSARPWPDVSSSSSSCRPAHCSCRPTGPVLPVSLEAAFTPGLMAWLAAHAAIDASHAVDTLSPHFAGRCSRSSGRCNATQKENQTCRPSTTMLRRHLLQQAMAATIGLGILRCAVVVDVSLLPEI